VKNNHFLRALGSEWDTLQRTCLEREYPPSVRELITELSVSSPLMQRILFLSLHHQISVNSNNAWHQRAIQIFNEDQNAWYQLTVPITFPDTSFEQRYRQARAVLDVNYASKLGASAQLVCPSGGTWQNAASQDVESRPSLHASNHHLKPGRVEFSVEQTEEHIGMQDSVYVRTQSAQTRNGPNRAAVQPSSQVSNSGSPSTSQLMPHIPKSILPQSGSRKAARVHSGSNEKDQGRAQLLVNGDLPGTPGKTYALDFNSNGISTAVQSTQAEEHDTENGTIVVGPTVNGPQKNLTGDCIAHERTDPSSSTHHTVHRAGEEILGDYGRDFVFRASKPRSKDRRMRSTCYNNGDADYVFQIATNWNCNRKISYM
jgi:hypothetical protein